MRSILLSVAALGVAAAAGLPLMHRHHMPAVTSIAADTLTSGVSEWSRAKITPTTTGETRGILTGTTHDLSLLEISALTLNAGSDTKAPKIDFDDELIIVKEGSLTLTSHDTAKLLGAGGVALLPAGVARSFANKSAAKTIFYLLRFKSPVEDKARPGETLKAFCIDWPDMTMQKTAKGESRQIFSQPTPWLTKIDMHATTLNPGEVSHPPHIHRVEEIILMRFGHVQMYINGQHYPAAGGDLVFLASGNPHALENTGTERCEYFALQWQQ